MIRIVFIFIVFVSFLALFIFSIIYSSSIQKYLMNIMTDASKGIGYEVITKYIRSRGVGNLSHYLSIIRNEYFNFQIWISLRLLLRSMNGNAGFAKETWEPDVQKLGPAGVGLSSRLQTGQKFILPACCFYTSGSWHSLQGFLFLVRT